MALGQLYVDKMFGAEGKERTLKMVQRHREGDAARHRRPELDVDTTKKQAYEKLNTIVNNIGYPDKWRDYSSVTIASDDYAGNVERASRVRSASPVQQDRQAHRPQRLEHDSADGERLLSPADERHQLPRRNSAAAVLWRPMDDAVNYGAIGVVIGHELTHGFDDQGRKYDAQGNLKDWWTAEDGKQFEQRADCTADEYSSFVAVKDDKGEVKLNGKLTLGENTADNGGLKLAYMALTEIIGNAPVKPIDGYTPQQRFFLAYGQIWCQNVTDQEARKRALTDPHSPGRVARERSGAELRGVPEGIGLQSRSADGERERLPSLVGFDLTKSADELHRGLSLNLGCSN